jgi:hypothetical protein
MHVKHIKIVRGEGNFEMGKKNKKETPTQNE